MNPYSDREFKSWSKRWQDKGFEIFDVVKDNKTGAVHCYGDVKEGHKILSDKLKNEKRKSLDWVPNLSKFKKLTKKISEMKQGDVKMEAPHVLKLFMENNAQYGEGDCFLWNFKVPLQNLKVSKVNLRNT